MLNKDEYNQEEYNDYYRQETEGAEAQNQDEESGLISKLIFLLIFLALAIAGYFGYKAINKSTVDTIDTSLQVSAESSLPQSIQEEPTVEKEKPTVEKEKPTVEKKEPTVEEEKPTEEKEVVVKTKEIAEVPKEIEPKEIEPVKVLKTETVNNAQSAVTSEVTKAVSTQGKMSTAEIAAVVAAVMQQMNKEKSTDTSTDDSVVSKEDSLLIDELSDSEVDSVSADLIKELENIDISENTKVDNDKKQIDIYNKVNVQNASGSDTLSQLSNQINLVMAKSVNKDKAANYTKSLKSEVTVRTNEMRIIVVKKGDTLGKIAKRAYGNAMEYKKIYKANPEVTRPDRIYIGQKLRIPN